MVMDMKSKMVVAMVGDYPENDRVIDGGVQAVTAYLVEGMKSFKDIDLHVVTFKKGFKQERLIRSNGFHLHALPISRLGLTTRYRRDKSIFDRCLSRIKPHIVHAQGAGREGFLTINSSYPSVITYHGIIGENAKHKTRFIERTRFKLQSLLAEKYCVINSKHNILISPYVSDFYGSKLRGKRYYIPNPVHSGFFNLSRNEKENRVLFAGKIVPGKGILDLIKAIVIVKKELDSIKLILAGSVDDVKCLDELKKLIKINSLEACVEIKGLLNEPSLMNEFSQCALLVLPSYQETAPMVIQQAMAAEIPVIATNICGIPNQVDDGVTGLLFQPHDVKRLADHITVLLKDQDLRIRMGKLAHRKALNEYHPEKVIAKIISVYREILALPGLP